MADPTTTTTKPKKKKKPPAPPSKKGSAEGNRAIAEAKPAAPVRSGARVAGEEDTAKGPLAEEVAILLSAIQRGATADPGNEAYGLLKVTAGYRANPGISGRLGGRRPRVITINEALGKLAQMDATGLTRLQDELLNAGFYPEGYYSKTNPDRVLSGQLDDATREAFRRLLEQAIVNPRQSLPQILTERATARARAGLGPGAAGGGAGQVGGANTYRINVSDPAAIRKMADAIGVSLLGRIPTDAEKARIVGHVQGAEAAQDTALNAASESQSQALFGAQVAAQGTPGVPGGSIISPVAGGGKFSDTMGADRDGGARKHKGTDIFGPKGSAAVAPVGGVVTKVGNSGKGGLRVWIRGDDGRYHYLAHLDRIDVKAGQRVEQGAGVGTVGTTGNASSTAPHVHYSINSSDKGEDAIGNPALELAGAPRGAAGKSGYLPPVTTTSVAVAPEARIEEELRRTNPTEAGAHDVANSFATFVSLIGGS